MNRACPGGERKASLEKGNRAGEVLEGEGGLCRLASLESRSGMWWRFRKLWPESWAGPLLAPARVGPGLLRAAGLQTSAKQTVPFARAGVWDGPRSLLGLRGGVALCLHVSLPLRWRVDRVERLCQPGDGALPSFLRLLLWGHWGDFSLSDLVERSPHGHLCQLL